MALPPSGEQFVITAGEHRATIVEVGGGIREYAVGDRNVLDPYPVDAMCDGAHGTPLIPWPNRLADGRYAFEGVDHQVALTEPEKHNAIHGLLRWRNWRAVQREPDRVVMACRLHPQPGYPFALDVRVTYELSEAGLVVRTTATNIGDRPCPYGSGQHPYLSPGTGPIDDCVLRLAAATWIDTANERQLPVGRKPTRGGPLDFAAGRRLGEQRLDVPFTDLERDTGGRAWVSLTGTDGGCVELWVDGAYPLIELYSGDTLGPQRRRRGLGTEPMTCPPNAFQSGEHLIRLQPDGSTTATWGVRLR